MKKAKKQKILPMPRLEGFGWLRNEPAVETLAEIRKERHNKKVINHRIKLGHHCDFHGTCRNKPYREVYPGLLGGIHAGRGWNYLCRRHYFEEQKKFKGELPHSGLD